jgi:ABC-2 type transport system permease protein
MVSKYEIGRTLRQRSFWAFTFLVPVLLVALQVYYVVSDNGMDAGASEDQETAQDAAAEVGEDSVDLVIVGLVDEMGLIKDIPAAIPPEMFVPFSDETAARAALEEGEIEQYVHVPADYLESGTVTVYDRDFLIRSTGEEMGVAFASSNEWMLRYLLETNLTGDEELVAILRNPVPGSLAERHAMSPPSETDEGGEPMDMVVATAMPYIYYFILLVVSGYLMRSVSAEKENRTAEVLLLSLDPRDLMIGKLLGLSIVALFQLFIWLGAGVLMMNWGSDWLNISALSLSPAFFVWAVLFLVFGYLLYASVMAAGGAIAPNAREAGKVTYLLIVPLMPTLMFGSLFGEDPNGTFATALSLFPFSAPSAMVTRLAVADVPLWQPLVSLLGLAITAYAMVLLAARFFRADNLLSDASFTWQRLATGWRE